MVKLVGQIIKYWDFLHSEVGEPSNLHTTQKLELEPDSKVRGGDHEGLRCSTGKHFPLFRTLPCNRSVVRVKK